MQHRVSGVNFSYETVLESFDLERFTNEEFSSKYFNIVPDCPSIAKCDGEVTETLEGTKIYHKVSVLEKLKSYKGVSVM